MIETAKATSVNGPELVQIDQRELNGGSIRNTVLKLFGRTD